MISAKLFLLPKIKSFRFVTIVAFSLKLWACKNDHFLFNIGISNLETRSIRLINRITSIIEESKLISENIPANVIHCYQLCVKHQEFHIYQTFVYRLIRPEKGSPPRIFILSRNLEYFIVFIKIISFNSAWFSVRFSNSENNMHAIRNAIFYIDHMHISK